MEATKINRSKTKLMLPETIALRKMRELLNLDRKQAALLIGKSSKHLEKIENGFVEVTPILIEHFLKSYSFPKTKFNLIVNGKFHQIEKENKRPSKPIIENNKLRRSYKRILTKDVEVLISFRKLRNLSQYQASRICSYAKCTIGHIENGRIELPYSRIKHIVTSYGFTMKDFEYHKKSEVLITDIQDECIKAVKKIDSTKLNAVHAVLQSFIK